MRCIRWKMFDNPNCGPMRLWLAATQSGWQANSQREPAIMAAESPRIQDIFNADQDFKTFSTQRNLLALAKST